MYAVGDKIDFLKRVFGRVDIYNSGNVQVRCPKQDCPSHSRKRKLAINIDKGDIFHCWVCGYRSRLVWLLKTYYQGSLYQEYIQRFCDEKAIKSVVDEEREPVLLPQDFRLLALKTHSKNPEIRRAIKYLAARGLTTRDLWYYKFGISNEGMMDNRVIMPSFDAKGQLNYFAARDLMPPPKDRDVFYVKYFLAKLPKTEIVFNEINIDWEQELTVTEGPFDLAKCNDNATILNGSDLIDDSLLFIKIVQNKTPVLLALDEDMQFSKVPKQVKLLMSYGVQVRVLPLGGYPDVGTMSKREFKQLRKEAKVWTRTSIMRQKIRGLT